MHFNIQMHDTGYDTDTHIGMASNLRKSHNSSKSCVSVSGSDMR